MHLIYLIANPQDTPVTALNNTAIYVITIFYHDHALFSFHSCL